MSRDKSGFRNCCKVRTLLFYVMRQDASSDETENMVPASPFHLGDSKNCAPSGGTFHEPFGEDSSKATTSNLFSLL